LENTANIAPTATAIAVIVLTTRVKRELFGIISPEEAVKDYHHSM